MNSKPKSNGIANLAYVETHKVIIDGKLYFRNIGLFCHKKINIKLLRCIRKNKKRPLISTLTRILIIDFETKKPLIDFYESLNRIRKMGNIINQMIARTHVEYEKFSKKALTNLNDLILNIKEYYLVTDKIDKDNAK